MGQTQTDRDSDRQTDRDRKTETERQWETERKTEEGQGGEETECLFASISNFGFYSAQRKQEIYVQVHV